MQKFTIINGDCLNVLSELPSNYFDAVLSDPPYGLSFMGKEWDKGVPSVEVYEQIVRVSKPGAFGIHFGGTRTYHRLTCNIEDAGFEVRDCLSWLYGSGFPKSYNISKGIDKAAGAEREVVGLRKRAAGNPERFKAGSGNEFKANYEYTKPATGAAKTWDGYGTALKPAWEPAVLVMKPIDKNFVNNVLSHGCGALNIDGCRVGDEAITINGRGNDNFFHGNFSGNVLNPVREGRFPANLLLDEVAVQALGEPSRFFYTAKVSTKERNAGCEHIGAKPSQLNSGGIGRKCSVNKRLEENGENAPTVLNCHPTLKPLALTTYLAKLLLPPEQEGVIRKILVPFCGAGSEVIGCLLAGWDEVIGIELDPEYVEIAKARVAHHVPTASSYTLNDD